MHTREKREKPDVLEEKGGGAALQGERETVGWEIKETCGMGEGRWRGNQKWRLAIQMGWIRWG